VEDWAIYIHVPFCRHKCAYCDFYSTDDLARQPLYLKALEEEILLYRQQAPFAICDLSTSSGNSNPPPGGFFAFNEQDDGKDSRGGELTTVYWGGGTPSLLPTADLLRLMDLLRQSFRIDDQAEITLEANPGALPIDLAVLRRAGFNRLSLGAQSFQEEELHRLTRIHSAGDIAEGFAQARRAGFDHLGLDLIYAIPGQTLSSWEDSLARAIELSPEHLSMYGLTFEPGTPMTLALEKGQIEKCDEELEREMFLTGKASLEAAGFEHYEISNFARPGQRSRHNQKYWQGNAYLGLGPAAHSHYLDRRWSNLRDTAAYFAELADGRLPLADSENLTLTQRKAESLLLGLRRVEGIDLAMWHRLYGQDLLARLAAKLDDLGGYDPNRIPFSLPADGVAFTLHQDRLALTAAGLLIYDHLCQELYANL